MAASEQAQPNLGSRIKERDVATIYELGYEPRTTSLELRICETAIPYLEESLGSYCKSVWDLRVEHELSDFITPKSQSDFGFDGVARRLPFDSCPGMKSWLLSPPVLDVNDATGRPTNPSHYWYELIAMSATLTVVCNALALFPEDSGLTTKQLMALEMTTMRVPYGAQISAHLAPRVIPWIRTREETPDDKDLSEPMRRAYQFMHARANGVTLSEFGVEHRPTAELVFRVHGDRCIMVPDDTVQGENIGYTLVSRNSGPVEQVTLAFGLAALHDQGRKAGL
jgi:hypothetical protein